MKNHEILEKNVGLLAIFMVIAVSIGGLTQIVPLFFQDVTNTPVEGMKPRTALELEGRDIYIREGCVGCHSQMVRPFRAETERYGHYSVAGESVWDHPFLWGSKRTGPDLASKRVMQAQGSGLTNKYAEGYPGKRYYGGCEHVDKVEQLAIDRARQLFGADYANVQPHSGSSANAAVYLALLNAGDTILGMSLAHGGHLTHGAKVSSSGKLYNAVQYGLDTATGLIDYDEVERLAVEHKPKMIVAGFSAYSKTLDFPRFRAIADKVGALLFVDMAHVAGLVAAGLYPNPIPFADVVTTTTHKTLRGPRGGLILARANEEIEKKLNSAVFPGAQGGQVRAGTLGTPQERVVPDALAGHRVVAVAFGLGAERTDHLRVAADAAFADIDVAAFQLQRGIGLHAFDRGVGHVLEEQRHDLGQAADAHGHGHA